MSVSRDKMKSDTVTQSKKTQEGIQQNIMLNRESLKTCFLEQRFSSISSPRPDYQNCRYTVCSYIFLNGQERLFCQKMGQKSTNCKRSKDFQSTLPLQI